MVDPVTGNMGGLCHCVPGVQGRVIYVVPRTACSAVENAPQGNMPWIALISRGACHFDVKVTLSCTNQFFECFAT